MPTLIIITNKLITIIIIMTTIIYYININIESHCIVLYF